MFRYQLTPPVKPVRWYVVTKWASSASVSSSSPRSASGEPCLMISSNWNFRSGASAGSLLNSSASHEPRRMKVRKVFSTSASSTSSAFQGSWNATT